MLHHKLFKVITAFAIVLISMLMSVSAQNSDDQKISQFNNQAIVLINQSKYDEATIFCDSALQIKANATSYYALSFIYTTKNNWEEGIRNGEMAVQLNPGLTPAYLVLFNAYFGAEKWKEALAISEKAQKADPSNQTNQRIEIAIASQEGENASRLICILIIIILSVIVFIPVFRSSKTNLKQNLVHDSQPRLSTILLLTAAVSCVLYILFFYISTWIWSFNPQISPSEFTPIVRGFIFEHDGMESFFLYAFMFINIIFSLFFSRWLLTSKINKNQILITSIILLPFAGYYFYRIGFFPPIPGISNTGTSPVGSALIISLFSLLLYSLYNKYGFIVKSILLIITAFTTLVVTYPNSLPDLAYVLSPALRLADGDKFSEIYFQYDILLSLFAFAWIKLNWALEWFPFLGQLSFLLFFLGAFLFSDRFFKSKGLSVLFLIALLLIRYYAVWEQGFSIFQVTPLRLDLWLILLLVGYKKGIQHWLFGICLGLLILLHRNLGLIYFGAYLILLITLFVIELNQLIKEKKLTVRSFLSIFITHFRHNAVNLGIIVISFILCLVLFGEIFSNSAILYRKYGIGMLPISKNSFYWYVPVVMSTLAVLLFYYRSKVSSRYFITALFTILLAISNSMYFFGRSHENNILNISGILVLALFVVFDLLITFSPAFDSKISTPKKNKKLPEKKSYPIKKKIMQFLPILFIALPSYFYSNRISDKLNRKQDNFSSQQYKFPLLTSPIDTTAIGEITDNSRKVYFLDFQMDFYYYYYGKYTPLGYFSPCGAWIFKKDLTSFLQKLLDDQYFIVVNEAKIKSFDDYLPNLVYSRTEKKSGLMAIHK